MLCLSCRSESNDEQTEIEKMYSKNNLTETLLDWYKKRYGVEFYEHDCMNPSDDLNYALEPLGADIEEGNTNHKS